MNETHCRRVVAESRLAACVLLAAGETFQPLLHDYRLYADAIHEIATLADHAEGERLQRLASQLRAMFHTVNEALMNRTEAGRHAQAERLGIPVDQVDARLYPGLPGDDADEATLRAYRLSISGQADRWERLGFPRLHQDRRHASFELVRTVWLLAQSRADIDRFLARLDELVAELGLLRMTEATEA